MLRVLQVVNAADRGGSETMVMNLYRNINRNEIQFDFTNHKGVKAAYDDEIERLGGHILFLPKFKGYNYYQYISAWRRLFKENPQYKIIHIHNYNIAGIVAKVARETGVRVIITHAHSARLNMSWIKRRLFYLFYDSLLNNSTHRFACGEYAGKFLFGDKAFTIIPNAIDVGKFKFNELIRRKLRHSLNIPDNTKIYGHIGSFRTPKNHKFLIEIFKILNQKDPSSKLIFIGSGPLEEEIKLQVKRSGIVNSVYFLGQRDNVNEWLSAFDVFLMPSLWEGFPVSVVEAQCAGLPCFISDVIDPLVDLTGMVRFLSLEQSPEEWVDAILYPTFGNRNEIAQKIENSNFEISKASNRMSNFYQNTLKENK